MNPRLCLWTRAALLPVLFVLRVAADLPVKLYPFALADALASENTKEPLPTAWRCCGHHPLEMGIKPGHQYCNLQKVTAYLPKYVQGAVVLVNPMDWFTNKTQKNWWRATNQYLPERGGQSPGLAYRKSKDINDTMGDKFFLRWESYVDSSLPASENVQEDGDWVRITTMERKETVYSFRKNAVVTAAEDLFSEKFCSSYSSRGDCLQFSKECIVVKKGVKGTVLGVENNWFDGPPVRVTVRFDSVADDPCVRPYTFAVLPEAICSQALPSGSNKLPPSGYVAKAGSGTTRAATEQYKSTQVLVFT